MPLGEIIAGLGLTVVFDIVVHGVVYWTGFVILKALTLGAARLEPFSTIVADKKRARSRDVNQHSGRLNSRTLSAGSVCLVGLLFYVLAAGLALFLAWPRSDI
jgi:hypothetical protein